MPYTHALVASTPDDPAYEIRPSHWNAEHAIARTAAEIAAGVTPTDYGYEPGNVLRYGTNTTPGTTDMTAAIQAAIDSLGTNGGRVRIPKGVYLVTSTLNITVAPDGGAIIEGDGSFATKIVYSGSGYCIVSGTGSTTDYSWFVTIRDLAIYGANATPTGGIKLDGTYFARVDNCTVMDFSNGSGRGILFSGAGDVPNYHAVISRCYIRNCPVGIYLDGGTGIGANSNYIEHGWFGVHSDCAIKIDGGDSNAITGCEFNGSTTTAIKILGTATNNKVLFNQFDGPTTHVDLATSASSGNIVLCNTGGAGTVVTDAGTGTFGYLPAGYYLYNRAGLVIGGPNVLTTAIPLTVQAPPSGSVDPLRVVDSAGNILMRVSITGALAITDGITAPGAISGQAILYVDTADGDLKVKFGDGTTKTIVVDT